MRVGGRRGELTERQRRFVAAYDGNATQAAVIAGYSERTAEWIGPQVLRIPHVQAAIRERCEVERRHLVMSRVERQEMWTRISQDEAAPLRERLRASELLARSDGDFLDRVEHTGAVGVVVLPELE